VLIIVIRGRETILKLDPNFNPKLEMNTNPFWVLKELGIPSKKKFVTWKFSF